MYNIIEFEDDTDEEKMVGDDGSKNIIGPLNPTIHQGLEWPL